MLPVCILTCFRSICSANTWSQAARVGAGDAVLFLKNIKGTLEKHWLLFTSRFTTMYVDWLEKARETCKKKQKQPGVCAEATWLPFTWDFLGNIDFLHCAGGTITGERWWLSCAWQHWQGIRGIVRNTKKGNVGEGTSGVNFSGQPEAWRRVETGKATTTKMEIARIGNEIELLWDIRLGYTVNKTNLKEKQWDELMYNCPHTKTKRTKLFLRRVPGSEIVYQLLSCWWRRPEVQVFSTFIKKCFISTKCWRLAGTECAFFW